jgi:hypothetical protein
VLLLADVVAHLHRCNREFYNVRIQLCERRDVELFLGKTAIAAKQQSAKSRSEFLISDLYPATLKYNRATELLVVRLEYETRVEKVDREGNAFTGFLKPAEQQRKSEKREEERAKREKRRAPDDEDFIDHANVAAQDLEALPPNNNEMNDEAPAEALPRPQRKRTKSMRNTFLFILSLHSIQAPRERMVC